MSGKAARTGRARDAWRASVTIAVRQGAMALLLLALPGLAGAQISVSILIAPPDLPPDEQPPVPQDGYVWTPGYWEYAQGAYYWVPGQWLEPPQPDLLWTPGYWQWNDGQYQWSPGYWDREIGYYGGVNYGYGYAGRGYQGGYWRDHRFFYNRLVSNVGDARVGHVYARSVESRGPAVQASYNGGGGVRAEPTAAEVAHARAPHEPATRDQVQHGADVGRDPSARSPGPANAPVPSPVHVRDLPPLPRPVLPSSGDRARDVQHQQQSDELRRDQDRERQALQQRQDAEHRAMPQGRAIEAERGRVEAQHAVQTHELSDRHAAQQEGLRQSQQRPAAAERVPPGHENP